jgi:hypothetical protein
MSCNVHCEGDRREAIHYFVPTAMCNRLVACVYLYPPLRRHFLILAAKSKGGNFTATHSPGQATGKGARQLTSMPPLHVSLSTATAVYSATAASNDEADAPETAVNSRGRTAIR